VERSQLGSDLGQQSNPLPVESYRKTCATVATGITGHLTGFDDAWIPAAEDTADGRADSGAPDDLASGLIAFTVTF
jgi:hypothetical protein